MIEMGGQRLNGSASQRQKLHPGFQPHRRQIHLSHRQSPTPQRHSRWWDARGCQWPTRQPGLEAGPCSLET